MKMTIGTGSGNKTVIDPWIGTAQGRKQVQKVWIGTDAGNKLVFQRVAPVTVDITASGVAQRSVTLTATVTGTVTSLRWYRDGALIQDSAALSVTATGLAPSTAYTFRVDAVVGGVVAATSTEPVTTAAEVITTKTVTLTAVSSASFDGSGANRNVAECYYGYYSSTQGNQKSLWCFSIPAEIRNCVAIDRIDLRIYNVHAFSNSGGTIGLVVHHGAYQGGFPATWPGATGILNYNGSPWMVALPKPGFMSQDGSGWLVNVQVLAASGRASMAEEFRVSGAQGIGLMAPDTAQSHYGYAQGASGANPPQIRITYRVKG